MVPIKEVKAPVGRVSITTPLITKLRNAKWKAYSKGVSSWKFFGSLLRKTLSEHRKNEANHNINNTVAYSKTWWSNIKQVTERIKTSGKAPLSTLAIPGSAMSNSALNSMITMPV